MASGQDDRTGALLLPPALRTNKRGEGARLHLNNRMKTFG